MQTSSARPVSPAVRPPRIGELWAVDLGDPRLPGGPIGHEQGGRRPALVVSTDAFNALPPRLCVVVPLTRRERGVPLHVRLDPGANDVPRLSFAKCEDVRSVSHNRLERFLGRVDPAVLAAVQHRLRLILRL